MPLWLVALLVVAVIVVLIVLARRRRSTWERRFAEFDPGPSVSGAPYRVHPWPPPPARSALNSREDVVAFELPLVVEAPAARVEPEVSLELGGGSFGGAGASGSWDDDETKRALAPEPVADVDVSADVCSVEPASEPASGGYEDAGASYSSDSSYDSGSSTDSLVGLGLERLQQ